MAMRQGDGQGGRRGNGAQMQEGGTYGVPRQQRAVHDLNARQAGKDDFNHAGQQQQQQQQQQMYQQQQQEQQQQLYQLQQQQQQQQEDQQSNRRRQRAKLSSNRGVSGAPPYFEEFSSGYDRRDYYLKRMEAQVDDAKRLTEEFRRKATFFESLNDDTEKRLQNEAKRVLDLEQQLDESKKKLDLERKKAMEAKEEADKQLAAKDAQILKLQDGRTRLERELYRMHQKKHDMARDVRRQIAENQEQDATNGTSASSIVAPRSPMSRRIQRQDEEMAVAYFSRPSPALAEEQNRVVMTQTLRDFFGCG